MNERKRKAVRGWRWSQLFHRSLINFLSVESQLFPNVSINLFFEQLFNFHRSNLCMAKHQSLWHMLLGSFEGCQLCNCVCFLQKVPGTWDRLNLLQIHCYMKRPYVKKYSEEGHASPSQLAVCQDEPKMQCEYQRAISQVVVQKSGCPSRRRIKAF